jgi:lysophospholipase L1-like esterase
VSWTRHVVAWVGPGVITVVLAELVLRWLVGGGHLTIPAPPPRAAGSFWDGSHPVFGVWHHPGAAFVHHTDCFTVPYRTNSVGARDKERTVAASGRRVVVLGDSFIEGWGIPDGARLTDLLESAMGIEFANFGMAHQGPYQYYLVYRDLARAYAHDVVLVGVLPVNDLFDLDFEMAKRAPSYAHRYRPYLVGTYPDYREVFYREPRLTGWLRHRSYLYNALAFVVDRARGRDDPDRIASRLTPPGLVHSYFYDFTDAQFDRLRYSLEKIKEAAGGRTVVVLLLPSHGDFLRYYQSGDSPLARRLDEVLTRNGMTLVDLLPPMFRLTPHWDQYYFLPCDYHLNPYGNRVAAGIVETELRKLLR